MNNPLKYLDPDGCSHGEEGGPLSGGRLVPYVIYGYEGTGFADFWSLADAELALDTETTYDIGISNYASYLGVEGSYTWGELIYDFYGEMPRYSDSHLRHSGKFAKVYGIIDLPEWERYGLWEYGSEALFKEGLINLESGNGYTLFYDTEQGSLNMVYNRRWMVPYRIDNYGRGAYKSMYDISSDYRDYVRDGRYLYTAGDLP